MPLHWQTVGLVGRDSVEPYNRNSGQRPLQAPKSQNQDPIPCFNKDQTPQSGGRIRENAAGHDRLDLRNWQAINIRTPADAFCQMATNAATGLDIELGNDARAEVLRPVNRDEWITLPVRVQDNAVRTTRGAMRVPSVIVADPPRGWRGPGLTKK